MTTTTEAFESAFAHHRAGRFAQAAALYQQILDVDPRHADALHLLGVAAHQTGQHEAAVAYISRAIVVRGDNAAFHSNLGEAYRALGKLDQAGQCHRQALRLDPNLPETHNNLGNVLRQQGDLEQAAAAYREAIRLRANYAEAHNNLGILLRERGELPEAIEHFQAALRIDPTFARAYDSLAQALRLQGKPAEAAECYRLAIQHDPRNADYHFGLAVLHQQQQDFAAAAASYREALALNPRLPMAQNNLGTVLKEQDQLDEAIECYRSAATLLPGAAEPYYNIGIVLTAQGRIREAIEVYREALRRQPNYVHALVNCGNLLERQGHFDEALSCYDRVIQSDPNLAIGHFSRAGIWRHKRRLAAAVAEYQEAIRLQPDYADAYNNLGVVFAEMGKPDEAVNCCSKGLELAPNTSSFYSNMAIALFAQGRGEEALAAQREAIALRPEAASAHSNLVYDLNFLPGIDSATMFAEHLEWAKRHAEPLTALAPPHANDRNPERRVRVGYVSAFFRKHAVNYFSEPMLLAHDHREFEIFYYSDVVEPDAATERLKASADGWRDVYALSDEELATLVREDAVDILVDLTGHIGMNRLPTFARKPAPIQVTYLGYQNTTGMSAMDYRITDERADPPGLTERFHTEKLVRLPRAFFCYQPGDDVPPVTPLPALEQGHVTFGSFNKFAKVTPAVIAAWLQILSQVERSRLLVLAYRGGEVENRLHVLAAAQGIDPQRIELCDKLPRRDYLKLIARADIALDPFPFNGHTTTCDSVWMGVPVVMLQGQTYVSRFGGSVLANVGLESWIADSVEQYVEIAVGRAADLAGLARLRGELRQTMAASPLLDFAGFTRNLEDAYRTMWRTWCAQGG